MLRFFLALAVALPAAAQSLHWRAVAVEARLERDGSLRVRERQQLVFDGPLNGAERNFNARLHHWLELHGIRRLENGREIPLRPGDLTGVDQYELVSGSLYRWRSRLPTDPPFASREITYILDYTWHNVLEPVKAEGKQFHLDHDFGLPWRTSSIDHFSLQLDFDPVWNTPPIRETQKDVEPGYGLPVTRTLYYTGAVWPEDVERPVPWWLGWIALLLFGAGAALLIRRFIRDERATQRFAPLPARFDPELLTLKPEIAGAIWDRGVGPSEVAATLARMAQEKKLTTRAEGRVLHLHLEVPRESLEGYDRFLVDSLFVAGDDTSTELVKAHYKSTGFDPARVIRPRLEWELSQVPGWDVQVRRVRPLVHVVLLPLCAFGLLVAALFGHSEDFGIAAGSGFLGVVCGGLACVAAWRSSRAIADFTPAFMGPGLLLAVPVLVFATAAVQAHEARLGIPILFMVPVWLLAVLHLVLEMLKIRDSREILAFRRRIAAARQFFIHELRKPHPALRDEWFPYAIAFGLAGNVDHWFRAFGGAVARAGGFSSSASGFSSGSSFSTASSSWSGGGGAFGGAGATGTWAMAAAAFASGVARPSARSGGGGSGGGSSSGGGGGGGW